MIPMNLDEYIDETEAAGFQWAADEMQLLLDHPEILDEPEFQSMVDTDSLPMIHFYLGVIFGIGFERHDS